MSSARFAHFADFRYNNSPVLQARTIPSPIVKLLTYIGPNRCHVVLDYSMNSFSLAIVNICG